MERLETMKTFEPRPEWVKMEYSRLRRFLDMKHSELAVMNLLDRIKYVIEVGKFQFLSECYNGIFSQAIRGRGVEPSQFNRIVDCVWEMKAAETKTQRESRLSGSVEGQERMTRSMEKFIIEEESRKP